MALKNLMIILLFLLNYSLFAQEKRTILYLGDSLTAGYMLDKENTYPALIQKEINKLGKFLVNTLNGSISGSTTGSGVSRLQWFLKSKPDILVLVLGANDGLRGLKIEQSKKNLESIVDIAKNNGMKVLILPMKLPPNYGEKYRTDFENMYSEIAKSMQVKLGPFILEKVAADKKLNLSDGIHPNEEGHKIMARDLMSSILELL